ncbi:MAG: hypothetical protein AVDCRST_MAG67-2765 [uncultured Solirubrobacteraceae bacterium]|uniref:Uncharacterized protein n=1 Tax=uncultured Solirubrobacteraceae bacterium TaxID=1162706 RepID=A0A6J4T2H6_9ACTN|nr:MAG: hypothetical protein AVDCRST_MAG67-2765 [uncultured Solirubrobacteraceae bacterium]
MVTPLKLLLAVVAAVLMLGLILGLAFIPDNTHDFCIKGAPDGATGEVACD